MSSVNATANRSVIGPGAAGSASPSTDAIGCASRTDDDTNASSAWRKASTGTSRSSIAMPISLPTSSSSWRVTPLRQPAERGGVQQVPSRTRNTFEPVASQRLPLVFAKMASLAPRSSTYASARTFSAYEIVLRPAKFPLAVARAHGIDVTDNADVGSSSRL